MTNEINDAEWGEPEPITVRRDVTISVRFSADEIAALREHADAAGVKLTTFIRQTATSTVAPIDRERVARAVAAAVEDLSRANELLRGAA